MRTGRWGEGGGGLEYGLPGARTSHGRSNTSSGSSLVDTANYNAACSSGLLAMRVVTQHETLTWL